MEKELRPCPFCGGKAKVMASEYSFCGKDYYGNKKLRWRIYIVCNKCRSRGKPIITDEIMFNDGWVEVGNFYATSFWTGSAKGKSDEKFAKYVEAASEAWNERR